MIREQRSKGYNWNFDTQTGMFARWGKRGSDDPPFSPLGPEILDIEISTNDCGAGCPWCYKSNNASGGKHMSLEEFERIIDSFSDNLTQIALGITDADKHPEFIKILKAAHDRRIVPNYTTAGYGLTDEIVEASAKYCGAVAVSVYPHNWDVAWEATERLSRAGVGQVNIHVLYHSGNLHYVTDVMLQASKRDYINAVVLLGLKPKGRGSNLKPTTQEQFNMLVNYAMYLGIPLGFDSCSAPKFENWARKYGHSDMLFLSERCESGLFSAYVDVDGYAWPCSFAEGHPDVTPVKVEDDFMDVWLAWADWSKRLLCNKRECPLYNLEG